MKSGLSLLPTIHCPLPVLLSDVTNHTHQVASVTILIVVPGNYLNEGRIQCDTSFSIEHGRAGITTEVSGNHFFIGETQHALQWTALRRSLHCSNDFSVSSWIVQFNSQVNNRHVRRWYAESHTSQLALQLRQYNAHSLSSAS